MKEKPRHVIEAEIREARRLYMLFGKELSLNAAMSALLENYRVAISRTSAMMLQNGVVKGCTACAAQPKGSCCFSGIEEGFDHVLLFINLLLGNDLPDAPELSDSCYFVGEYGCKLEAKSYFCLHYLCPDLQKMLGTSGCEALLGAVGEELNSGWELERAVRRWLAERESLITFH